MKKIVIFLMLIFGMNVMALFVPCAKGDTKCVIRGFKVNEYIKVGIITQKNIELSIYAKVYVEALKEHLKYTEIL